MPGAATKRIQCHVIPVPRWPIQPDILSPPLLRLTSRKPFWLDLQPVDIKSRWRHNWKSAQVVNSHLVCDPTIWQPGFDLPRQQWSLLKRFRTEQGHCVLVARPVMVHDTHTRRKRSATCHIAGCCHLANSMSCHHIATCHIAGCWHLAISMSCHPSASVTLQSAAIKRIQCHVIPQPRATLQVLAKGQRSRRL